MTRINIITSASSHGPDVVGFVSRVFAPAAGVLEDHVCGSAHCLLIPYWTSKLSRRGEEILAKQVGQRGGDLKVRWLESEGLVALGGQTRTTMKGELFL